MCPLDRNSSHHHANPRLHFVLCVVNYKMWFIYEPILALRMQWSLWKFWWFFLSSLPWRMLLPQFYVFITILMNKVSTYVTCKMSLDIHVKAFVRFFKRLVSQHLNFLFFILDLPLPYINGQPNFFLVCEFFVRFELE
jgi:hypothetical protein